jgi:iron complex outermembrane receptor protein
VLKYILPVSLVLASLVSQAQEFETVVQETIFNSSDRVVIDRKQIEVSKVPNLTSLLATQANITVTTTPFQPTSLFLRGGDSSHIVIIVDGVPFYDGTSAQRSFNLNMIDIRTIERVEVIKGSQSVLFGGQALSGVIKITTIGSKARQPTVVVEAGSFDKANIGAVYQKDLDHGLFSAHARAGQKNAPSPILKSGSIYPNQNSSADLVYRYDSDWFAQGKISYVEDDAYSPGQNAQRQTIDADDFKIHNQQTMVSVVTGIKNQWKPQLMVSQQWSYRTYNQPSAIPSPADQVYDGETTQVRFDSRLFAFGGSEFTGGLSYTKETMKYKDTGVQKADVFSETRGVYLKYDQIINPDFKFALGGRYEFWDSNSGEGTGQLGLVYRENTKFEVATGYKVPSLFQLYSPDYGNTNLDEERSVSYSLSHQQALTETMNASVTFFVTQFSDLIVAVGGPPKYSNVAKSNTKGIEGSYAWSFASNQQVSVLATYQEPWDETNKRWLYRRPLASGSIRYVYSIENWQAQAELLAIGARGDVGGEAPGFLSGNIAATYDISANYSAYARIDNITDNRYQDSYSFYNEGLSATLGLSAQF